MGHNEEWVRADDQNPFNWLGGIMAQGFFTKAVVDAQKRVPPKSKGRILDCDSCGLFKGALSPRMDVKGQGKKRILFIGEAPGVTEDEDDDIFVGKTGNLLRRTLKRVGINLDEDAWRINAVNCWPGKTKDGKNNATPTNHQIACCRQVKVMTALGIYSHIVLSAWSHRTTEARHCPSAQYGWV